MATHWVNPKLEQLKRNPPPELRMSLPLADTPDAVFRFSTVPSVLAVRQRIVCTDDCQNCVMFLRGCAKRCSRFPDLVCQACPCRGSEFAGEINKPGSIGDGDDEGVQT